MGWALSQDTAPTPTKSTGIQLPWQQPAGNLLLDPNHHVCTPTSTTEQHSPHALFLGRSLGEGLLYTRKRAQWVWVCALSSPTTHIGC